MIPVPPLRLPLTSSTVPARLPVCSYSSGLLHCLILPSSLCKNHPFPCTIPLWIGGGYARTAFVPGTLALQFPIQRILEHTA
jgi:hypothetical protein